MTRTRTGVVLRRYADGKYETPDKRFAVLRREKSSGWFLIDCTGAKHWVDTLGAHRWPTDSTTVGSLGAARDQIAAIRAREST